MKSIIVAIERNVKHYFFDGKKNFVAGENFLRVLG
jgi:hypothetical protein